MRTQANAPLAHRLAPVMVMSAALCWGLSGGVGAILLDRGWSAPTISLARCLVGLAVFAAWLLLGRRWVGARDPRAWAWSAVAGLGIAGNFGFYFLSMAEGSVAVAATLMYCAPVFVFAVAFLCGLERLSWFKGAAIALVLVGVALLTRVDDVALGEVGVLGVAAGVLSGVAYATFIFGFDRAAPRSSPPFALSVAFLFAAAPLLALTPAEELLAIPSDPDRELFLLLGILGGALSFVLYLAGLRRTAPTVAAVVAMIEPVTAAGFGWLALDQALDPVQLTGMGLVLMTVTALGARSADG